MRADADRVGEGAREMEFARTRYSRQFFESERTADIVFNVIDDSSDTSRREYFGERPCIGRLPQPRSNQSSQDSLASNLKIKLVTRKAQGESLDMRSHPMRYGKIGARFQVTEL
jgi:hypothetical protein